jgi:hypothetical protein
MAAQFVVPLLVASIVATAGSTVMSVRASKKAQKAQGEELLRQQREEEVAAKGKELERRRQVNRVLAAQAAAGGASQIGFEGTPVQIATTDVKKADLSDLGAQATLSGRQQQTDMALRAARQLGRLQRATTILSGTSKILSTGAQMQEYRNG